MIIPVLGLLIALPRQAPTPVAAPAYVVSILDERAGDDVVVRFILSGPPSSYSAAREGDDILVRIAAEALPGLSVPASRDPILSLVLGSQPGFSLRVALRENRAHEIVRDFSSLRLILRKRAEAETPALPAATPASPGPPEPSPSPSPTPERSPNHAFEAGVADTADLYRRLFPSTTDPTAVGPGRTEIAEPENWYSNFRWLGLQARPWVSVSYVSGKTTEPESNTVTANSYWVVQPNLGIGFGTHFGGPRGGEWTINYTPRFRRGLDGSLTHLTSHFFDASINQPVASFGSIYGNYHFSTAVLETEEIDPGREYGIGLNRIADTSLQRFSRNSFGLGVRFDFLADTQVDINASKTSVRYGDGPEDAESVSGERAFFDYDARTLTASLRRGLGAGHFVSLLFGVHDTPTQVERKQVEGRGYSYSAAVEGDIATLMTGRILFGYRTQKNPNAGVGGRDYKDITYGAQLVRELSEDTTLGLRADRALYLSAYEGNGFYVADGFGGDLNTRLPLTVFLRGSVGLQSNDYEASPQTNEASGGLILRKDRIQFWSVGLTRAVARWASLRVDYISEHRNSNLDRFDINSRAFTFQFSLGFFGKPGRPPQSSW